MKTVFCFLSAVGFQELLLLLVFLGFIIGIPLIIITLIVTRKRKRRMADLNEKPLTKH